MASPTSKDATKKIMAVIIKSNFEAISFLIALILIFLN
jgi:hypothetical protein